MLAEMAKPGRGRLPAARAMHSAVRRGRFLVRHLAAPAILRLALGRPATAEEQRQFGSGFNERAGNMPPLLLGLLNVASGRDALLRSAQIAWHHSRATERGEPSGEISDLQGNLFTAWTGGPLGFLHIEKCGGCALLSWLAQQFHPEQIHADPLRDLPPHLYTRLPQGRVAQPLIWGHYDFETLRRFDPDRPIFTLLREPRARLVSLYHYWRAVDPANFDADISFAVGAAHRLSLEDFLNHDDPCLVDSIDNIYVRRLTGIYATGAGSDLLRVAPEAALKRATERLKTLLHVGVTERMEESAAALAARFGIAPPAKPLRSNVTQENHQDPSGWFRQISRSEPSAAVQAALDRRTALDRQLYAAVRRGLHSAPEQTASAAD